MPTKDLTIAMVGSGGDGVVTMGDMLAQAAAKDGLNVIKVEAYGPQIRGGESSCTIRISPDEIFAQGELVDVLVVFNWADFGRFKGEVVPRKDAVILFEEADPSPARREDFGLGNESRWLAVPFSKLATDAAGTKAAKNIVTLGILSALFGFSKESTRKAVEQRFTKKKAAVLEANLKGFDEGIAYASRFQSDVSDKRISYERKAQKLLMSGNEATALGAIHAGCRFFAGYPITPSSEVLHFLSEWLPRMGGSVVQTEDELSAIGAVIGGSFAGVKSMTATSGPGLALMTEMLGLSSMAEVPVVIVDVQRGGPSTGLPTKSEQSDLWEALYGTHGDAPRVVLAPSDVEDSFHTTVDAFNIAEEFQLPVIVLSDQSIAQRRETLTEGTLEHAVVDRRVPTAEELSAGYKRYLDTPSGVSPMSSPGLKGGIYQTNGLEHTESGSPSSMFLVHEKMNDKRYRKLRPIAEKYHFHRRYGVRDAEVGILCWGSSKGPVKEAILAATARGEKVAAFVPQVLYPFPKRAFEEFLSGIKEIVVMELSFSAQFYKYLRTFLTLPEGHTHVFKRSGGKNLTVIEVEEEIRKAFQSSRSHAEVLV